MPLINERELVLQAQAGNSEAFGQLYDAYMERIYRIVCNRVQPGKVGCAAEAESVQVSPGFKEYLGGNVLSRLLVFHAEVHKAVNALHIGVI